MTTTITGRRWTRGQQTHPVWCDVVRCQALSVNGEHRSEPIRRHVPGIGVVVATLTQFPGRRTRLDVTLSTPLPGDDRDVLHAETVTNDLVAALARLSAHPRRAAAVPSGARPARAIAR
ncbi:hypothetical protein ABZ671_18440 [Micromonospora sp. NPDC006766]|uniref:hypothetical protein n=1 Tax=Micromonospora sp. NPDC006766 TaxID=3154778 RepID=UPI0033CA0261